MAVKKQTFELLPSNTKVEIIAIDKVTGQAYKKIMELQKFKNTKKSSKFNYLPPFQIGFSQFKDAIEI
jgi:hypothetical protein